MLQGKLLTASVSTFVYLTAACWAWLPTFRKYCSSIFRLLTSLSSSNYDEHSIDHRLVSHSPVNAHAAVPERWSLHLSDDTPSRRIGIEGFYEAGKSKRFVVTSRNDESATEHSHAAAQMKMLHWRSVQPFQTVVKVHKMLS